MGVIAKADTGTTAGRSTATHFADKGGTELMGQCAG